MASSPIPAGAAVNAGDTRLVKIHRADGGLRSGLLAAGDLGGGWVAAVRIDAGDPITRSVVTHAAAGSGLGAMSIPVPVDRADGGGIGPGDRVDVLASDGNGGASYVAQGLTVVAVSPTRTSGVLAGASSDFWVTVAVDRATALRLTAALGASGAAPGTSLEVVRSTGETAPAPQTSYAPTAAPGGECGPLSRRRPRWRCWWAWARREPAWSADLRAYVRNHMTAMSRGAGARRPPAVPGGETALRRRGHR